MLETIILWFLLISPTAFTKTCIQNFSGQQQHVYFLVTKDVIPYCIMDTCCNYAL